LEENKEEDIHMVVEKLEADKLALEVADKLVMVVADKLVMEVADKLVLEVA
jgi:hypothetical protein